MFSLTFKKISQSELCVFFRQLATLMNAGIPIVQSLEILSHCTENTVFKKSLLSIQKSIEGGRVLSESMKSFPRIFDPFSCYLIYVGEQAGTLPSILKRIADHKEKALNYKRQLQQALLYPITVLCVALIVLLIMLFFVVPRFSEIFQNMHRTLPSLTLFVIHLSDWLHVNYDLFIIFIVTVFYFKKHWIHRIWKCPLLGTIYQKNGLSHFAHHLATTLRAGIAITDALQMMMHTPHAFYSKSIAMIYHEINKGQSLYKTLIHCRQFPALMVQMVKVGEESGTLEEMLEKISELFASDVDHFLKNLNHLLEPLIMVVLGVLIGGLVIAMYLPIFKLGAVM